MNKSIYFSASNFILKLLNPRTGVNDFFTFFNSEKFWNTVVKVGSNHLILPAIFHSLRRKKLTKHVPNDLMIFLKKISEINKNRNLKIMKQIRFISKLFYENKIDYVLLKGSALLKFNAYDAINERMVGDIDILVRVKDLQKTQKLLKKHGFKEISDEVELAEGLLNYEKRHLKRLVHKNFIAAIEIHRSVIDVKKNSKLNSDEIFSKRIRTVDGLYIPSKNHLWEHAIYNWQFNDLGLLKNYLSFKTVNDVFYLQPIDIGHNYIFYPKPTKHFYNLLSLHFENYKNRINIKKLHYLFQLSHPIFFNLNLICFKFLSFLKLLFLRMVLFISKKKYRNKLFKNPKTLFNKVKNFWKS